MGDYSGMKTTDKVLQKCCLCISPWPSWLHWFGIPWYSYDESLLHPHTAENSWK